MIIYRTQMAITSLSKNNIREIEEILVVYAPGLTPRTIKVGIQYLQGPILEYVNKYVPEEYNDDFRYMDTWDSMFKDIMDRGSLELPSVLGTRTPSSSVIFETPDIVTPLKGIVSDLPIEENIPAYMGPFVNFRGIPMSFRNRVAVILTLFVLISLVMTNDSYKYQLVDFVTSEKDSFVNKVISSHMSRQADYLKKKDFLGNTIG